MTDQVTIYIEQPLGSFYGFMAPRLDEARSILVSETLWIKAEIFAAHLSNLGQRRPKLAITLGYALTALATLVDSGDADAHITEDGKTIVITAANKNARSKEDESSKLVKVNMGPMRRAMRTAENRSQSHV
jgi:hypothetical protein